VRTLLQDGQGEGDAHDDPDHPDTPSAREPPPKRSRLSSAFAKWKAPAVEKKDEVTKYLDHAPSIDVEDVYSYWRAEVRFL